MTTSDSQTTHQDWLPFQGKTIALGVCGGIAAYKACDLIRELYRQGAERVICLMTESAQSFVTPTTLQSLSRQPVHTNNLGIDEATGTPTHIWLAQQCDVLLILPATVNTIAKLAGGFSDDILATTFMTFAKKPVVIAPAMNTRMWEHPLFQENLDKLATLPFVSIVSPTSGHLACGETGDGHLADQATILQALYKAIHPTPKLYAGQKVLVTAGGTREAIDPVRFITNRSSGKMGIALADELWAMGAEVTLVSTVPVDKPYMVINTQTASQMKLILEEVFPKNHALFMAAAVSDFGVPSPSASKIKRTELPLETTESGKQIVHLALEANPDILAGLGQMKQPHQRLIGFAAESGEALAYAQDKLHRKNLDAIVLNDISRNDIGFDSQDNEGRLLLANGQVIDLKKAPKQFVARQILTQVHQTCFTQKSESIGAAKS